MKRVFSLVILLAFAVLAAADKALQVDEPYVRAMPPGQSVTAAFLVLKNLSGNTCTVNGGSSVIAGRLEMHEHRHEQGMMKMRPVSGVTIPAGGQVDFQPGGLHIMLFDIESQLLPGETVPIVLTTDVCGEVNIQAEVRSLFKPGKGGHHS